QTVVKSYSILSNLELDSVTEKIVMKPFDQVLIRRNPDFELQQNIYLQGLVRYEGTYPRLSKNETLSSYIARAGGLKDNANLSGAILYRKRNGGMRTVSGSKNKTQYIKDSAGNIIDSVAFDSSEPVSIDLDKALKYKDSKYDLVLQEGDMIIVPEINP